MKVQNWTDSDRVERRVKSDIYSAKAEIMFREKRDFKYNNYYFKIMLLSYTLPFIQFSGIDLAVGII